MRAWRPEMPTATLMMPLRQVRPKESEIMTGTSTPARSWIAWRRRAAEASGSLGRRVTMWPPGTLEASTPELAQTRPWRGSGLWTPFFLRPPRTPSPPPTPPPPGSFAPPVAGLGYEHTFVHAHHAHALSQHHLHLAGIFAPAVGVVDGEGGRLDLVKVDTSALGLADDLLSDDQNVAGLQAHVGSLAP